MKVRLLRTYHANKTSGRLFVDGQFVGNTLEDCGRPLGIKIPKETCIPEGQYFATINQSNRWKRLMIQLYSNKKGLLCDLGGITFTGIRVHRGTKIEHTEGCILFAGDLLALETLLGDAVLKDEEISWWIGRDEPPVAA